MPPPPHRLYLALCRRVAFAFFGVLNGTEVNPEFEAQVSDDTAHPHTHPACGTIKP